MMALACIANIPHSRKCKHQAASVERAAKFLHMNTAPPRRAKGEEWRTIRAAVRMKDGVYYAGPNVPNSLRLRVRGASPSQQITY